jgi:hypothetical protein
VDKRHTSTAFAVTQPDMDRVSARFRRPAIVDVEPVCQERESHVRVRESNAPLSSELRQVAEDLRVIASAMFQARMDCDPAVLLGLFERATFAAGMAAHRLRAHTRTAEVYERELIARMEGGHE